MNIGIDIDGVLVDFDRARIDFGTKMCIEENLPIKLDVREYSERKAFDWNEEQTEKFWNKYLVKYVKESRVRAFAPEIIKMLQDEGDNVYIITARNESGMPTEYYGKMQELTREWLEKQGIKYEKLIFAENEEKLSQCLENNIDVMIEDSSDNIKNISSKIKVIKFDCQYNKNIENENITTAYSWYHIYRIIKEMRGE